MVNLWSWRLPVGKPVSRARRDGTSVPSCSSYHTCCCSMLWVLRACCLWACGPVGMLSPFTNTDRSKDNAMTTI